MGLRSAQRKMKTGGFSTERPWRHGRAGCLACHWRFRLSCLPARAFVTRETEPREAVAGPFAPIAVTVVRKAGEEPTAFADPEGTP